MELLRRGAGATARNMRGGAAGAAPPNALGEEMQVAGKPTVEDLGIDVSRQSWQRSGVGDGSIEVAVVRARPAGEHEDEWVLMRVSGDPDERVLVYDRHEWECFLDGARKGEFDTSG